MRILVLSAEPPYPPSFGGARLRLYHLLRLLSQKHEFTLLTLLEKPEERADLSALAPYCRQIISHDAPNLATPPRLRQRLQAPFYRLAYSEELEATVNRQLSTANHDLVHVDTTRMAVYTPLLRGKHKLMSAVDCSTLGYRNRLRLASRPAARLRAWALYRLVRRFEWRMYQRYDACTVVAERDAAVIQQLCPQLSVAVVPNGVELPAWDCATAALPSKQKTLVFTGTMDYGPNIDAMRWFVWEILPLIRAVEPSVRLAIVGRNPTPVIQALTQQPGITVTGYVPDVQPWLAAATAFVCPLREGSGMKNKVLEAMAARKAVVTTTEGIAGIAAQSGTDCLVADMPKEFAHAVVSLLHDDKKREALGRAARRVIEGRYTWAASAEMLDKLYHQLAQGPSPPIERIR